MGPALSTEELKAWGQSRGLSKADTEQLVAVGEERDQLEKNTASYDQALTRMHEKQRMLVFALQQAALVIPDVDPDHSILDYDTDRQYKEACDKLNAKTLALDLLKGLG